jgi:hypothetical protein
MNWHNLMGFSVMLSSVADPWHFGVDPDPDLNPRIHASDSWIRIRIHIQETQKQTGPTDPDSDPEPDSQNWL